MKALFSPILFLLIVSIFFSISSFSQDLNNTSRKSIKLDFETKKEYNPIKNIQKGNGSRNAYISNNFQPSSKTQKLNEVDTLNYPLLGTYSIYSADAGGYVTGNNVYGDLAKANKYVIQEACLLTGILFDFYYATGGPEDIEIVVWDNSGENNTPGEIIGSKIIPLNTIQNDIFYDQMSFISFDEPIIITTSFYAGMVLPTTAGDTLVVWSNADGDIIPGIAWEQQSNHSWYAMFQNSTWFLNLALAIFPIVEYGELPLMADFMSSSTNIQPGGSVTYTDLSTGNPNSRLWTFEGGDPATSTESNLVVVYEEEGIYDVTLNVENDTAQDTKTIEDYITVAASTIDVDTLNYPLEGSYAVYVTGDNGFVTGNNEFGDLAKANYYNINENSYITGVLFEFAYGTGSGSSVEFAIWNNSGANNGPGSKIAFQTLPLDDVLDDVASESFTYVEFNPPVLVNGPFYAGVMLPTTTNDTLVIWSNNTGDTQPGIAWELWNTNDWFPISSIDSWGLHLAMAIYPIIQTTLSIHESFESGILDISPNPSGGKFTIDLSKQSNHYVQLEIYNTAGNCILNQSIEQREKIIEFDISDFQSGVYMLRLNDGKKSYTQKIVKR